MRETGETHETDSSPFLTDDHLTQPLTRLAARRQERRTATPPHDLSSADGVDRRSGRDRRTARLPRRPVLTPSHGTPQHDGPPRRAGASSPTRRSGSTRPSESAASARTSGTAGTAGTAGSAGSAGSAGRATPRGSGLARASALMASGTAVSRVLGFARAAVLAEVIGANTLGANTFALANTIPNTLYLLIAGGVLNAVLVPQVVKAMKSEDGGAEYLDRLVTAAVVALAVVTGLLVLAAPLLVEVASSAATGRQRTLTIAFAVWCLPQVFFYALYTLLGQILNAKSRFGAYMWAPAINNVVAVVGLVVFVMAFGAHPDGRLAWTDAQVAVLAGSSTLGVVAQAAVLIGPLRAAGVRLRPRWGLRGVGLGSAGRSGVWVVAGLVVGLVGFLVTSNVSAYAFRHGLPGVATPGYAVWQNAYLLFMLPHSLVAVSLVTALFTRMSQAATAGRTRAVRGDVSHGLRTIAVASVLGTAGLIVLARPAAVVLTGAEPATGRAIAEVIVAMVAGMVPFSANYLLQRAFYAFEDARTPFLMQVVSVVVWVLGSLIGASLLPPQHIVAGAAAAMSLGQLCSAAVGVVWLRERLHGIDGYRVLRTHSRLALAALLASAGGVLVSLPLAHLVDAGRLGALVVAVVGGTVMLVVYGAALVAMRVEEVRPLARRLARPLVRRLAARRRP